MTSRAGVGTGAASMQLQGSHGAHTQGGDKILPQQFDIQRDSPLLVQLLQYAMSASSQTQSQASSLLELAEERPGYCALCLALATNQTLVESALQQALQQFGASTNATHSTHTTWTSAVQLMAIICLKNAIRRRWKASNRSGGASTGITEDEKQLVRSQLLQSYSTVSEKLSKHVAVAIAKIARSDWPDKWPDLFPTLLNTVSQLSNSNDTTSIFPDTNSGPYHKLFRTLLVLHTSIKELSLRKIPTHKKIFAELSEKLFPTLVNLCTRHVNSLIRDIMYAYQDLQSNPADSQIRGNQYGETMTPYVRIIRLESKVLYRLMRDGFGKLIESNEATEFWSSIHNGTKAILRLRTLLPSSEEDDFTDLLENVINRWCITAVDCQARFPIHFRFFISSFLELFVACLPLSFGQTSAILEDSSELINVSWERNSNAAKPPLNSSYLFPRLAIAALRFITDVVEESMYVPELEDSISSPQGGSTSNKRVITATGDQVAKEEEQRQAHSTLVSFFTANKVSSMVRFICTVALPYTTEDLESWKSNGENFEIERQQETTDVYPRPAAEALLLALITSMLTSQSASQALTSILQEVENAAINGNEPEIWIILDAVYCGVGIGSFQLCNYLDFASWFRSRLYHILQVAKLQGSVPLHQRVVLRRSLWLTTCWRTWLNDEVRACIFESCSAAILFQDASVSLTAFSTLHEFFEDHHFQEQLVSNYLVTIVSGLYGKMKQMQTLNSKVQLAELGVLLTNRLSVSTVGSLARLFLEPVEGLWVSSDPQNVLRPHLLTILTNVCRCMGDNALQYHDALSQFVVYSVDVQQQEYVYLAEEGLQLWLAILETSSSYSNTIAKLFPLLTPLIQISLEHVQTAGTIVSDYAMLGTFRNDGKNVFVEDQHNAICAFIHQVAGQVTWRGTKATTLALDDIMRTSTQSFSPLIDNFAEAFTRYLSCAMNDEDPVVSQVAHLSIWCRLFWQYSTAAVSLLAKVEQAFIGYHDNASQSSPASGETKTVEDWVRDLPLKQAPGGDIPPLDGSGSQTLALLLDTLIEQWDNVVVEGKDSKRRCVWLLASLTMFGLAPKVTTNSSLFLTRLEAILHMVSEYRACQTDTSSSEPSGSLLKFQAEVADQADEDKANKVTDHKGQTFNELVKRADQQEATDVTQYAGWVLSEAAQSYGLHFQEAIGKVDRAIVKQVIPGF